MPDVLDADIPLLVEVNKPLEMRRVEIDDPHDGEVRVRMTASGVCHSCLHAADGTHQGIPLPIVLGDEGAGVVDAVGPGCADVAVGDHVIVSWAPGCGTCRFCAAGRPGLCLAPAPFGRMADGTTRFRSNGEPVYHYGPATYGPYTVIPERGAVRIAVDVPLDRAALIGCAVTTGCGAVLNTAKVRPGESVAVFGCGGVGLNAVQGARLVGATPIVAVDLLSAKLDAARGLGATMGVDASVSDPVVEIDRLMPGGVDHALVAVGSAAVVEQAWAVTGPGGTCVLVGNPPTDTPDIRIAPHRLLVGERRLVGSVYGSANPPVDFLRLVELYRAGKLELDKLVTRRFTLDQADEAFVALAAGELARGLIVF